MSNPTTPFGWQMPTATDLVTDLPADFEVFGQAVATSMADLLGGASGYILAKNSATDMDFVWIANDQGDITGITAGNGITVTSPTGPVPTVAINTAVTADLTTAQTLTNKTLTSPALTTPTISTLTTNGDLLYGTGSGALTRLGIGSATQVLTVAAGVPSWATPSAGFSVNLLLNSNFALNQRGYVSAANLASGAYGFDRWKSNFTSTTLTFTASTQGQSLTINAGGGLQQVIEQGLVPAGTYTLSWTGTATARVYNSGGTPPSYAASPVTFTADGAANVVVEFTAVSTTKTVSKVQFNLGTGTTWSLATPTLQTELAACQRYYAKSFDATTTPANNAGTVGAITFARQATSGSVEPQTLVFNRVTMRVAPTVTLYNPFSGTAGQWSDGSTAGANARIIAQGQNSFVIDNTDVTLAVANAQIQYAADSEL